MSPGHRVTNASSASIYFFIEAWSLIRIAPRPLDEHGMHGCILLQLYG